MSFWGSLLGWLGSSDSATGSDDAGCTINPASGLPMVGGCGGVDVEGNPYGTDLHSDATSNISDDSSGMDSMFNSGDAGMFSSFDDTFSSFDDSSFSSSDD